MKSGIGRRRLLRMTGVGLAATTTATAGCTGLLGGNRSHGDPATYRRWTGRTEWLETLAAPFGRVVHEDAVGRVGRLDGDVSGVGERDSVLLNSAHTSTVCWSGFGAAPTTSSAETVASALVDEGGSRLDADLPDDHFAVHRKWLYVVGPDGVTFGMADPEDSGPKRKYAAEGVAQEMTERPDEYTPTETWEEQVVTLTEDLGIPDYGFYRAFGDDDVDDSGLVGLSRGYYFDDDGASVVVSGLFADEADAEAFESFANVPVGTVVSRLDSPSTSTDGEFVRVEGRLGYRNDGG